MKNYIRFKQCFFGCSRFVGDDAEISNYDNFKDALSKDLKIIREGDKKFANIEFPWDTVGERERGLTTWNEIQFCYSQNSVRFYYMFERFLNTNKNYNAMLTNNDFKTVKETTDNLLNSIKDVFREGVERDYTYELTIDKMKKERSTLESKFEEIKIVPYVLSQTHKNMTWHIDGGESAAKGGLDIVMYWLFGPSDAESVFAIVTPSTQVTDDNVLKTIKTACAEIDGKLALSSEDFVHENWKPGVIYTRKSPDSI